MGPLGEPGEREGSPASSVPEHGTLSKPKPPGCQTPDQGQKIPLKGQVAVPIQGSASKQKMNWGGQGRSPDSQVLSHLFFFLRALCFSTSIFHSVHLRFGSSCASRCFDFCVFLGLSLSGYACHPFGVQSTYSPTSRFLCGTAPPVPTQVPSVHHQLLSLLWLP